MPTRRDPIPQRSPDNNLCRAVLAAAWEVRHWQIQQLLPGLTAGQLKTLKRKERTALERRRFLCERLRQDIRRGMPPTERQLRLPLHPP
jgi:hypothetical protein